MVVRSKYLTGKTYLKLEKYPNYSIGNDKLDKVLLNLGFIKLVRRIKIAKFKPETIELAEKIWGKIESSPINQNDFFVIEYDLRCFSSDFKTYYGRLENLLWLLEYDPKPTKHPQIYWSEKEQGYIGFSHRAAQVFKIGDKLFDARWIPNVDELHSPEIYPYALVVNRRNYKTIDDMLHKIVEILPFRLRGKHIITNKLMAYTAAKNFAEYVS